jgi:nuclear pore complex protein Nup54
VQLEEIEEEVRRGRLRGKLNELWAVVGALVNGAKGGREGGGSGTEWTVVDEDGLGQIAQVCSVFLDFVLLFLIILNFRS